MIRSTKTSIYMANRCKREYLHSFLKEYRRAVQFFIDEVWGFEKVPIFLSKTTIDKFSGWLSKRALQCAGKQASGIVRGVRTKHDRRIWVSKKILEEGDIEGSKKLINFIDAHPISKPQCNDIEAELDARFIKMDWNNQTSFDGWLTLSSFGKKLKK